MTTDEAMTALSRYEEDRKVRYTTWTDEYYLTLDRLSDNYFCYLVSEDTLTVYDLKKLIYRYIDEEGIYLKLIRADFKLEVADTHAHRYSDVTDFTFEGEMVVPVVKEIEPYLLPYDFSYTGIRIDNTGSGYPNEYRYNVQGF